MATSSSSARLTPAQSEFLESVEQYMTSALLTHGDDLSVVAVEPLAAGGKRLRPLLVRAAQTASSALQTGAAGATGHALLVRAAASVEFMHTASLVHDDVLDRAEQRRGRVTTWNAHGRGAATHAGDLLFSQSFLALLDTHGLAQEHALRRALRLLARTARTLAEGEAVQALQLRDVLLSDEAYMHRCSAKTGVLFSTALQLGAILTDAETDDLDTLARFGNLIGLAFQVTDDVLDCTPELAGTSLGKQPGTDLLDGTMTLPILIACRTDDRIASEVAAGPIAAERVPELLDMLARGPALEESRATALELRDSAIALLDGIAGRFDTGPLVTIASSAVLRLS